MLAKNGGDYFYLLHPVYGIYNKTYYR